MSIQSVTEAIALMQSFAERTGLTGGHPPRRYLWTDAFAVCNLLGLARATGEDRYAQLALRLVEQVHHTLGRHRDDDSRTGWLSRLGEQEGEHHPTRGGLRIGKALPERSEDESLDERLEWDRDGQYFHYLTKWMHALDQVARATGQSSFNLWARELAQTAFDAFTYSPSPAGPRRMYWKMSIDLSRALVPSMGQHDPLDGYITCLELRSTATEMPAAWSGPDLANETSQFADMLDKRSLATADPLGIGGLLLDAYRVYGLMQHTTLYDERLLEDLLAASVTGLRYYTDSGELSGPAEYRLAFRELGLAIGLHAVESLWQTAEGNAASAGTRTRLDALRHYGSIGKEIEEFWLHPKHRGSTSWNEHRDINEVMLATSLAPTGFLINWPL